MQYNDSNGKLNYFASEGLMNLVSFLPSNFKITSTDTQQSILWIGTYGNLEVKKVLIFDNENLYFSTSVIIKYIGTSPIYDFYCK